MKKFDARKLTAEERGTLRNRVIELRAQHCLSYTDLAQQAGVHVRTVQTWLKKASCNPNGVVPEKARGRSNGTCRKLSSEDELWIVQRISSTVPDQLGLSSALWTRQAVQALIYSRFSIDLSDRLARKYLERWGYVANRTVNNYRETPSKLVQGWFCTCYPAITLRAEVERAGIYWADETPVNADSRWTMPEVCDVETSSRPTIPSNPFVDSLSMFSVSTNRQKVLFRIFRGGGGVNCECFIEFLESLIKDAPHKIFLIVDTQRIQCATQIGEWLELRREKIELFCLPLSK
jgi:transposase